MISKNKKKVFSLLLLIFIGSGIFFLAAPAQATASEWAGKVIGGLIGWIISALGVILVLVIQALIAVAQYGNFINSPAVSNGWHIVRDICNMFFVLILLIIAFATILKQEEYSYKKWLPKLILMAILINFSKTICGLLIDVAQVVMLTFVNAFKGIAAGNLITNLGITDILTLANTDEDVGFWAIIGAYVLGLIYILIALVVVVTMLAMLVMRIVMIWIYVVLSPAAYLFSAFPGGQKYASQWWGDFSKNLIVGPVLAFFIWLSFVSLQTQNINTDFPTDPNLNSAQAVAGQAGIQNSDTGNIGATKASTPEVFIRFIIAIGMLLGGLQVSQQIGGAAGGMASKGMAQISKGAAFTGGAIGGFALGRAKAVGGAVGRSARNQSLGAASWLSQKAGNRLNKGGDRPTVVGDVLMGLGGAGLAWRSDMRAKNKKTKDASRQKFLEKMGMGEKTMDKTNEFLKTDTGKRVAGSAKVGGVGALVGSGVGGPIGGLVGGVAGLAIGGTVSMIGAKVKDAYTKRSEKRAEEATQLQADADAARAGGDEAGAKALEKKAKKKSNWAGRHKEAADMAGSVETFASETTQRAAAKGSEEINQAKERVGVLATDTAAMENADGFAPADFYSKSGQTGRQKKLFDQLANKDNANSIPAINNMASWVAGADMSDDKVKAKVEAIARGVAAFAKGGGDTSQFGALTAALDAQTAGGIGSVDSLKGKVIANRKTGKIGEQGSGEFNVNTFAENKEGEANKNVIGVDFEKMKGSGLDVKAEGSYATGATMAPIIEALKTQISGERVKLDAEVEESKKNGTNTPERDKEFAKRAADLDNAEKRLNDPNLKNLNLVNTGSKNYGRKEKMTSVYHEEIHAGGLKDEKLTEGISQKLMTNELYGRNAATGGRHATEIAQKAKGWKDEGMSNKNIMSKVDDEIKTRNIAEGKSRAERVANLEKGKKETQSQAIGNAIEAPSLSTDALQKSLDVLADKVKKMSGGLKPLSGVGQAGGANNNLLYPLRRLNSTMRKNVNAMKELSKKTGGQAPTTIIEAAAINDEINS